MSLSLFTHLQGSKYPTLTTAPLIVAVSLTLFGCSSFKTPNALKNLSLPNIEIPENDPSFRKRIYAGTSFGKSKLKPDTSGTIYDLSNDSATASQIRLGIDLHNKLSVELNTSVLGKAQFTQGQGTDVSYTSASIDALIYGLTGNKNRSRREGFSGYGRIGYGIVQHGSIVLPFDYSENSVLLGIGAEYGFSNGLALRAEFTRIDSDATVMGVGGIYRFGMAPKSIGQVFVNAAKPALGAAHRRTEVHNGKVVQINSGYRNPGEMAAQLSGSQQPKKSMWTTKVSKKDLDGDGVLNAHDQCKDTVPNTTVANNGCGMFDASLSDVTFKPGSVWLTPKARGALDSLAVTLLAFPEARIQIRAHTDSEGAADVNLGLSARRAESVVSYLKEKGIGELQLETLGLGESQPIDSNDTAEGRKRNRRIELVTLANIDMQKFSDNPPSLGAANEVEIPLTDPVTAMVKATQPQFGEPVFPPMSGVKIEALPKSEFVAGLTLGGILHGVEFREGTATLTPESVSHLKRVREQLLRFPQVRLVIMGHTDDSKPEDESKALTQKQAEAVAKYLVSTGINASRLQSQGFGSSLPVAQNLTEDDRRRNRRIELRVVN